jgi:hypothetical protein
VEGEACTVGRSDDCWGENLVCVTVGASAICVARPRPGEACTDACEYGAYCQDHVCVRKKAAGAPCVSVDECASGRCFIPSDCVDPSCLHPTCAEACAYPPPADGGS